MALTIIKPSAGAGKVFEGDGLKVKVVGIDKADANYLTNGFDLVAADVGMEYLIAAVFLGKATTNVKDAVFNGPKVVCYSDRGGTQVANDTDISGQILWFLCVGR